MKREIWHTPVTLTGGLVRLEPLSEAHVPGLAEAGRDESIWKFMLYGDLTQPENMAAWVRELLARQAAGTDLCFTVIHLPSGRVAGATRYMEMRPVHKGLEIGGTWYAPEFQRTGVNTECKYLMLKYAFEMMGCIRVQFKADVRNERSCAPSSGWARYGKECCATTTSCRMGDSATRCISVFWMKSGRE
jgi:RimJ/RimL family protein N-acetyltransferase